MILEAQFKGAAAFLRQDLNYALVQSKRQPEHKDDWIRNALKHLCQLRALEFALADMPAATESLYLALKEYAEASTPMLEKFHAELGAGGPRKKGL